MSLAYACGNCECVPCECAFEADNDFSLNLKLKPGKYYKKMHWPDELYFQVCNLGRGLLCA